MLLYFWSLSDLDHVQASTDELDLAPVATGDQLAEFQQLDQASGE